MYLLDRPPLLLRKKAKRYFRPLVRLESYPFELTLIHRAANQDRYYQNSPFVQNGFECGVALESYNDVKVGDVIEVYELEEHAAVL